MVPDSDIAVIWSPVMPTFGFIPSAHDSARLLFIQRKLSIEMSMSAAIDNVVAFAPYQARRTIQQRQPRPYVLWYPGLGFVQPASNITALRREHSPRATERA